MVRGGLGSEHRSQNWEDKEQDNGLLAGLTALMAYIEVVKELNTQSLVHSSISTASTSATLGKQDNNLGGGLL